MPVSCSDGGELVLDHGAVMIAAITSCTNTSNPSVMIGAALLARNAVEKGLARRPWVKTSMAPGSKVVMDYYERAGLWPYLEKLGFNLVGYGCTTCIGNSGPLSRRSPRRSTTTTSRWSSVLSGNRNFEGRINPDVKMNYLASPPLVVAYALAGTMDFDLAERAAGHDSDGNAGVPAGHLAVAAGRADGHRRRRSPRKFTEGYADVFAGDERWRSLTTPEGRRSSGTPTRPTCASPRTSRAWSREPARSTDLDGARVLLSWATR